MQGNFRHEGNSAPVSREELMTVLSGLERLHIQGLHFTETQRLTLGEVGLEEASDTGSGPRAHLVEMCACPPDYTGDSCQVGNFPSLVFPTSLRPHLCLAFPGCCPAEKQSWSFLYLPPKCAGPDLVSPPPPQATFRGSKHAKDLTVSCHSKVLHRCKNQR